MSPPVAILACGADSSSNRVQHVFLVCELRRRIHADGALVHLQQTASVPPMSVILIIPIVQFPGGTVSFGAC